LSAGTDRLPRPPAEGEEQMGSWPQGITAITLFAEDLDRTRSFYQQVFGLPVV